MKCWVLILLFMVKVCQSNDLECGRSVDTVQSAAFYETLEFYCDNINENLPANCSTSFSVANVTDKTSTIALKVGGCGYDTTKQIVANFPNLHSLDVSESGLKFLDSFGLQRLVASSEKIYVFHLRGNDVGKLSATTFERFTNLEDLNLSNTNLTFNDLRPFEPLQKLNELDISRNNLECTNFESPSTVFKRLHRFYASDCKIINASKLFNLFGSPLSHLDLSGNNLEVIEANAFENIESLHILNLSRTNLLSFDFTVIAHQIELVTVDLTKNKLEIINMNSMPAHLQSLFLSGNNLMAIDNLTRIIHLSYLSIDQNQLQCEYLKDLLSRIKQKWPSIRFIGNVRQQKQKQECIL